MQDYMKTIVNGLMTYNKNQKADWNENDASAIGYIKNRTHWTGKEWGTIIEKQSDEAYLMCPLWLYSDTDADMMNKIIYLNETYKITFNGTVYYCTSWKKDIYANQIFLGNKYYLDNNEEETQEPFLISYNITDRDCNISFITRTAFQIKIEGYIEKIHKIDSKYLPLQNLVDGRGSFSVAQHSCSAFAPHSHAEGEFTITSASSSHAEGYRTEASGVASHAEGQGTTASGNYGSHAEGYATHATGDYGSHAEGGDTTASGESSHAEGCYTTASGDYSHAEGVETEASGNYSHAEGAGTIASDDFSHAEGVETEASGEGSHAEGGGAIASGDYSHAEGGGTIASGDYSHVQGKYNIADTKNKYVHIVGNGETSSSRSNAHTLDWNGNAWFAGTVKMGGTSQDDETAIEVATKNYVDEQLNSVSSSSKLISHVLPIEATEENQTIFPINLETFDAANDTILVQDGITLLLPNSGFTIENNTIVMTTPWGLGDTGGILILKNTPILADEVAISGAVIENNSITLDKLSADITTKLDDFVPLSGGNITGDLTIQNNKIYHEDNKPTLNDLGIMAGTEDLEAGVSALPKGHIYLVLEE